MRQHTRIHGLREHALDQVRRVSCQQGLDVPHRLLGYVQVVLHGCGGESLVLNSNQVRKLRTCPLNKSAQIQAIERLKRKSDFGTREGGEGIQVSRGETRGQGMDNRVSEQASAALLVRQVDIQSGITSSNIAAGNAETALF